MKDMIPSERQKTSEQIAAIEEAQAAADAAMSAVIEYLRTAVRPTSEEAHKLIDETLARYDCISPEGHIVAGGLQAAEPHERGHGAMSEGEAIVIDIFPRSIKSGYWADMSRTVCIGTPSDRLQKMYDAVLEAQELAVSHVRPGTPCKQIQEIVEKFFRERGYETSGTGKEFAFAEGFVHSVGHGVGLNIHEAPHVSKRSAEVLQEGDVITIEPGLYYHDIGGIRIEDIVVVTKDGYRNLAKSPKRFSI